jgi:4-amino-4-deoxy-L-arabinose transferase-like glycosyltransferase
MPNALKTWLVLLALLLPAFLLGLGERPVYKIQEVRIAETAREMLASGDWVVPRYNGDLRLQKPPLPYWLTATSYKVGGVNETTTRLPAVLFGLLSALMIWNWVRRESGFKIATNSMLVLAASYIGLRYFRSGEADAMLLFFISAACMLGCDMLQGRHDAWRRLLFGLVLGLGFLSKGPAALAIPLLSLLAMAVIEIRAERLQPTAKQFFSLPGVTLLLVAAFGWYVWIIWQLPDVAQQFFGKQLDETFVSGSHAKPVWWYFAHLFEFFAPWGVLLIPAGWMAYRQRGSGVMPLLVRFAWIWLAVVFVLLTATVNKQMQYALLFAPPIAIIIGHYLALAEGGFARANGILFWIFCVAALAGIAVVLRKSSDVSHAWVWLALPVVPLMLQRLLRVNELSAPVLLVAGVTAMSYLYGEAYLSKEPRKVAAQAMMVEAAKYAPLYQPRTQLNDGALSFYAGRVVPPVDAAEIPALLLQQPEIWLVGEEIPNLADARVQIVAQVDDLKLCRLQRKP